MLNGISCGGSVCMMKLIVSGMNMLDVSFVIVWYMMNVLNCVYSGSMFFVLRNIMVFVISMWCVLNMEVVVIVSGLMNICDVVNVVLIYVFLLKLMFSVLCMLVSLSDVMCDVSVVMIVLSSMVVIVVIDWNVGMLEVGFVVGVGMVLLVVNVVFIVEWFLFVKLV